MGSSVSADVWLSRTVETVVLTSGGLDSAVLLAHEAESGRVHPLYVRVGLSWEDAEIRTLRQLLASPRFESLAPLETLEFNMRDVYTPSHWAIRGTPPDYDTPDEDVYLPGRNLVLLTKAGVFAASKNIERIALGPLADNPFPDATPEFFAASGRALSLGLDTSLAVVAPFASLLKEDVIRLGDSLNVPLHLTLSCMNPDQPQPGRQFAAASAKEDAAALPRHCGLCSKCRERRDAFAAAGLADTTSYAQPSPR